MLGGKKVSAETGVMDQKVYGEKKIPYTQLLPFQLKIMAEAVMNISQDGTTGGLEHRSQTGP